MEEQTRRTWAEVSLKHLSHNYHALRAMLPPACRFMGMVKSDAYGHGALPIARCLQDLGADYFGVACLDEALELRYGGVDAPILILGGTAVQDLPLLLAHDLAQTVFDLETARCFSEGALAQGTHLRVHVKVDTGMTRLGFFCGETALLETAKEIQTLCALEGLETEGIFTHFSDSDGDEDYTLLQMQRFLDLLDKLEAADCHFAIRHAANSAATILYPFSHLDMVRPGIALYGHYPGEEMECLCDLRPVMELRSRVTAVRMLPAESYVSYGRTHCLTHDSKLAVVPIGYGDGFSRSFSNRATVSIHGVRVPIVGRVCMDMCMADVTDLPALQVGDEVVIYSRDAAQGATATEAAQWAETISYELLCALSKRIPRRYED